MRILVIDDSETALDVMKTILENAKHEVLSLESPLGVTRIILREDIQVVVVDVNLASLTGDKLTGLFRANARMAHIGVVLVSAMLHDELQQLADVSQADAFVTKSNLEVGLPLAVVKAHQGRRPSVRWK